jgi:hypothetical protein
MNVIFQDNLNSFLEIFDNIDYCNADEDYDKFCKINKDNEKRKSLSSFFVNLTINGVITREKLVDLIHNLLNKVLIFINQDGKKNEVDEMIENIAILYNKEWHEICNFHINEESFMEIVNKLAHSKAKMYPSLSNKSRFKFMDMIEM